MFQRRRRLLNEREAQAWTVGWPWPKPKKTTGSFLRSATEGDRRMNADYICPKCGGADFKRWELPHPTILFWVLNPAVVVNEVILGTRIPKLQLICRTCQGGLIDCAYVPCPACKTMHMGRLWSRKRGFGNWRGIACPICGASIPCLWNIFSLIILAATSPIWALPYCFCFRKRPLKRIYDLENGELPKVQPVPGKMWFIMGAAFGAAMWLCLCLAPWLFMMLRHRTVPWLPVLMGIPVCGLGGVVFGAAMWFILGRKLSSASSAPGDSGGKTS